MNHLFTVPAPRVDTDERFTPAWVFAALGETFDLDVAAPIEGGDHVPAVARWTREDDGRAQPWHGFVWCNPPFSEATVWADRFIAHGNGLFLGPVANAAWAQRLAQAADRWMFLRDFAFDHPSHSGRRSSMPLVLAALGERAAAAIDRSGIAGVILRRAS
jgi:hypothetical protein